ncbi:hypothetical protein ALC57_05360 [Trachymyrmex cornetzi]|uniref:Uncharacterized protein n=1 Tax=Trachymyrmex cornetzi TaxID=471704 RepID=A0A151JAV3_9HYME|nr:hypothetical protein ALC57_05360 [Trachymyrmex cornetzi]
MTAINATITTDVKLSRCKNQPWGFRLSGGVDFTFPLTVVRVRYNMLMFAFYDYRYSTTQITYEYKLVTTLISRQLQATVGPRLGQRWQYVGNRWSRQSRREVGPTYVSRLLLIDEARANVGSMSATGGHANHGATSAQRTLADSYLLTKLGPMLVTCRQSMVKPITARRRPNVR